MRRRLGAGRKRQREKAVERREREVRRREENAAKLDQAIDERERALDQRGFDLEECSKQVQELEEEMETRSPPTQILPLPSPPRLLDSPSKKTPTRLGSPTQAIPLNRWTGELPRTREHWRVCR